jgi:hypothetical protein
MVFYARFQDGSTKGRLALVAIFILLLTAASALVERPPGGIVAPPDRFVAVEIPDENIPGDAVSDRASFVVAPEQFATEEPTTTDTGGSVIADPEATKYHADAVAKILDDKVHDGVGNGYAPLQESHLVVVAHEDPSIAVKNLNEMTSPLVPYPVMVVATQGGFGNKTPPNDAVTHDGGLAVDAGEILGGPFDSYHDARLLLRKTTPLDNGVDPTVQLSQARPAVVAPPDRFIAVEVPDENIPRDAVSDRASFVVAPERFATEEPTTKDTSVSVIADPEATKYHGDAVAKILDDRVHDGVRNGYAPLQESHLVVVAHEDLSIAVKNLDEMTTPLVPYPVIVVATPGAFPDDTPRNDAVTHDPIALVSDPSIGALALDETASDGGLAVDAGEILGGPFDSYHDARLLLRKTEPLDDGVDPTVQLSQARPAVVAPPDRFIAVEVPDENIPRGAVSDRASSHFRPIVITADQYAAEELNMKDPGGSVVDPEAIDPAVQFTQGTKRSLQVLKGTDSTKKSMQVLRGTVKRSLQANGTPARSCTLIAAYNTDLSVDEVCKLTETLNSTIPDAEPDASAIDVNKCFSRPGFICPIRPVSKPRSRRLVSPPFYPYAKSPQATPGSRAPADTPRSLQHVATLSPTSAPSPGFILFNATSVDRNCSEIAAALMKIEGVFNVSIDIEGTTTMGRVSDNFIVYQTEQKFAYLSIELLHSNHRLAVILQIQFSPSLLSFD